MTRQNLIIAFTFTGILTLISCANSTSETKDGAKQGIVTNEIQTNKENLILDIKSINGRTLSEVEKIIGKAEKTEKVKGYPCKNTNCQRAFFKNGEIEIIFKLNKASRITINNTPNLTDDEEALTALGLGIAKPTFKNSNNVVRWQNVEGISEISFFTDYILIQFTEFE